MVAKQTIYKCDLCGNIVEVLTVGGGTLVCCGKPMAEIAPKSEDPTISKEKHLPVVTASGKGIVVKVGAVAHPMEEKHFIEWIGVKTIDGKEGRKYLTPGQPAEATFEIAYEHVKEVFEYCNMHGLWVTKVR